LIIISPRRYKPATANELLQAFQTLDTENKGFFSLDFMQQILREGESFSDDEITEALKIAFDPDSECIYYDLWIHKLMVIYNNAFKWESTILNFYYKQTETFSVNC